MEPKQIWTTAMKSLPVEIGKKFSSPRFSKAGGDESRTVSFDFNESEMEFKLFSPSKISHTDAGFFAETAKFYGAQNKKILLMSPYIYPKIAERLASENTNYLDATGNLYIDYQGVYILRTGQKGAEQKEPKSRLFGESGIRLIFGILYNPDFIALSYREMAAAVGISAASITILLKEMERGGYLYEGINKKRIVHKKSELLERWTKGYHEQLKPKITLGTFTAKKNVLSNSYKQLDIEKWGAEWSGEPAANLYTNYLSPEKFSMFADENNKKWRAELVLIPQKQNAELEVFKYFWDTKHRIFEKETNVKNAVPALIVYAELVGSGDSRNVETAKIIADEYLQDCR